MKSVKESLVEKIGNKLRIIQEDYKRKGRLFAPGFLWHDTMYMSLRMSPKLTEEERAVWNEVIEEFIHRGVFCRVKAGIGEALKLTPEGFGFFGLE